MPTAAKVGVADGRDQTSLRSGEEVRQMPDIIDRGSLIG
jgi:hypothetical protein